MILTEEQFFDYIFCPAKYDIKYRKNIQIADAITTPRLLNKMARYFYLNILNGKVPSVQELKSKWDSFCKANMQFIDARHNLEGWGLIVSMVNWAEHEKLRILDVDAKYSIVTDCKHELVGQMNPIVATQNNSLELLVSNFSSKNPDQVEMDTKLKYTIDCCAFQRIYKRDLNGVHIKMFKTAKDFYSIRTASDYKHLDASIDGVCKGIQAEAFYPRENALCSTCTAREYCRRWC